jgi:F0F1-type ATP synthase assembly protein I
MFYYWVMDFCLVNSVFFGRLRKGFLRDYPHFEKLKSNVMKFHQMLLGAAIFLTACSSPKYVYHFDHYDYNSGKKIEEPIQEIKVEQSPLAVNPETVVASANHQPLVVADEEIEKSKAAAKAFADKYKAMSKTERKELRKELKKEIKSFSKKEVRKENSVMSVKATQAFDTLVSLAMIFGGAGIVLIMLANISNVFWIVGAISLVIGAVLFVKWVANGNG